MKLIFLFLLLLTVSCSESTPYVEAGDFDRCEKSCAPNNGLTHLTSRNYFEGNLTPVGVLVTCCCANGATVEFVRKFKSQ